MSLRLYRALVQNVTNTAMSPVAVPTTRVMAHRFAARRLLVVHHLFGTRDCFGRFRVVLPWMAKYVGWRLIPYTHTILSRGRSPHKRSAGDQNTIYVCR